MHAAPQECVSVHVMQANATYGRGKHTIATGTIRMTRNTYVSTCHVRNADDHELFVRKPIQSIQIHATRYARMDCTRAYMQATVQRDKQVCTT